MNRAQTRRLPRASVPMTRTRALVGASVLVLSLSARAATAADRFDVDQLMHDVGLSPDAAAGVRSGEIVVSDPAPSSPHDLAVGLTFLVQQPLADVLAAFRGLATTGASARVTDVLRRAFARYRAYLARRLDGIAPYARAGGVVRKPGDELLAASEAASLLRRYALLLWQLLHSRPRGELARSSEARTPHPERSTMALLPPSQ